MYTNDTWHWYAQEYLPCGYYNDLPLVSSIISLTCTLECKTIISSVLMHYAKCHNVDEFSLERVTYVDK